MTADAGEIGAALDRREHYRKGLAGVKPWGINPDEPMQQYHVTHALRVAEPYYWAPPLCRLVTSLATTIPGTWKLHRERLPSASGFFSFAECLPIDERLRMSAIAWYLDGATLHTVTFIHGDDATDDDDIDGFAMLLDWHEGDALTRFTHNLIIPHDDPLRVQHSCLVRTMAASFALLEQELLVTVPERPSRAWRRRAAIAGRPDVLIRVVKLRRVRQVTHEHPEHDSVEWSCRWLVRGHWREQWYPRLACHQPVWIMEHEKGPEDKPLKPPAPRVFAVVR